MLFENLTHLFKIVNLFHKCKNLTLDIFQLQRFYENTFYDGWSLLEEIFREFFQKVS